MDYKWGNWTSESATFLLRLLGLLLLCSLWLQSSGEEAGIILLLFLLIMTLARWRFQLPGSSVLLDQVACLFAIIYWPLAAFALILPVFESMYQRKPLFSLPTIIFVIVYPETSFLLVGIFVYVACTGAVVGGWKQETKKHQREADKQRRDRYELENLKEELLFANVQATRMAELSERNRIAQQLHDEVGHELTASVLALQAYEQLRKEDESVAEEMFTEAQQRLHNSADYLRETVHNLKPITDLGIDELQNISDLYTQCPVNFQVFGDTSKVPAHLWSILYPCLKEALTNTIRHAKPTGIEITLDVGPHILRLSVYNDGVLKENSDKGLGIGLRNLRHRTKAVGGSISTDTTDGFLLICVLPLE
ncbi:sensor histidine kinase [Oceanobacillus manasiensis]|uniref:sensor histidine kinase n=1 Tax=Oceanobacillus manasiensis TaxID=586413 RepID=UPI0005A81531|nr:histidine kinase [Oceanobacillus manasiensis]